MSTAERFPIIFLALQPSEWRDSRGNLRRSNPLPRFEAAVAALETGIREGAIANVEFVEAKGTISNAVDEGWDKVREQEPKRRQVNSMWELTDEERALSDAIYSLSNPGGGVKAFVSANRKRLAAIAKKGVAHDYFAVVGRYLDEVAPLAEMIEAAKGVAVKRKIKTEEERAEENRYVPPPTAAAAMARVQAMLEKMVDEKYQALVSFYVTRSRNTLEAFLKAQEEAGKPLDPYDHYMKGRYIAPGAYSLICKLTKEESYGGPHVKRPDADAIIRADAEKDAAETRDFFIFRNLRKIDSIIDAKGGDYSECRVLSCTIDNGGVEGSLYFAFADGSSFTVYLSVVWKHSTRGKPFAQFPVRFHNPVLPNGERMKDPSEERMNTVFLGKEKA